MMMMIYYCLSKRTALLNTHTFTPVESDLNTLSAALAASEKRSWTEKQVCHQLLLHTMDRAAGQNRFSIGACRPGDDARRLLDGPKYPLLSSPCIGSSVHCAGGYY
jgi:hypothetical protein